MTSGDAVLRPAMRGTPVADCDICGSAGALLYTGLNDIMGNVSGEFGMRQCTNAGCGCLWLDPRPVEADIHLAYHSYYTHRSPGGKVRRQIAPLRIAKKIGKALARAWESALNLDRRRSTVESMYLEEIAPGRVLDVGCGDGQRLLRLRQCGWEVQGQEVDTVSAELARAKGIPVHLGELAEAALPEESFDAIIMNHVIEHLYHPVDLLRECHRLLSPGGILVAVTPNGSSYGARAFGRDWRGLEPPRHIRIFTQSALRRVAQEAGFGEIRTWTTPAHAGGM